MYYRVSNLAKRWQVSESTIYRWVQAGAVPGSLRPFLYTRLGHTIRWSQEQLDQIEQDMVRPGVIRLSSRRRTAS